MAHTSQTGLGGWVYYYYNNNYNGNSENKGLATTNITMGVPISLE